MSLATVSTRTCLQCQAPIEGRADKKFCTSSCKASYSREAAHTEPVVAPVAASRPQPPTRWQSASRPFQPDLPDWQARCMQAEQALLAYQQQAEQARQAAVPFDQEYARVGQLLSQYPTKQWTVFTLHDMLYQLQAALTFYQQHPGLANPLHVAHRRLQDLQQVRDYLQENTRWLLDPKQGPGAGGA